MVSAYWISLDSEPRAEQFDAYARIEALEVAAFATAMGWGDSAEIPAHLLDQEIATETRKRFPNTVQGWTQRPMKHLVHGIRPCWPDEQGRAELNRVLRLLHLYGDRHSHVGSFDTFRCLRLADEGQVVLRLGSDDKWVGAALVVTVWVYGQIFDLAAQTWALADIDSWRRRWRLLICRCQNVSRDQTYGVGRNDPCPCGSGFKFKRCHLEIAEAFNG